MKYIHLNSVSATLIAWSSVVGVLVSGLSPMPAVAQTTSLCSGVSPTARLSSSTPIRLSHPEFEAKGWKVMLRTGPSMACDSSPIWADDNLAVEERGIYAGADQQWSLLRFTHNGIQKERWAETRFLEVSEGSGGCHGATPSSRFSTPRTSTLSHPQFEAKGWKVMLRTGPSMTCNSDPIWADDNLEVEELGTYAGSDQTWSLLRVTHNGAAIQRWAESRFLETTGGSGGCSGATPSTVFSSPQSRTLSHPQYESKGWKVMLRTGPSMDCASDPIWADDNLQVEELGTYAGVDQIWSLLRFTHGGNISERWAETKFLEVAGGTGGCQGATPSNRFSPPRAWKLSHPEFEAKGWKVMLRTGPSMECGSEPIWADDNLRVEELGRYAGPDQSWSLLRFSNNGVNNERWAETKFLESAGGTGPTGPTTPINPLPNNVPIVIYDTDMGPDIDDALALAALHAYESQGMAHIAAVTLSRNSDTGARYIDLLNTFYARPDIPVGVYRGETSKDTAEHGYTRDIVNSGKYPFSLDVNRLTHGYLLMRDVLRASPDNSVIIIQVGFSTNTARLLEDYPDLVARKARLLSVMAGDFVMPEGHAGSHGEFNVNIHPSSARTVFDRWPNQMVVSEVNLGASILYPLSSIRNDFNYVTNHPIKDSYLNSTYDWHHENGNSYDMRSWDITSVVAAIEPNVIPRVLGPGKISLTSNNNTLFSKGGGSHYVLAEAGQLSGTQRQQLIDLMVQLTSTPPGGGRLPVSPPTPPPPEPPTPPSEPPGGPSPGTVTFRYTENPILCDGQSRKVGQFEGFSGNEQVRVRWNDGGESVRAAVNGVRTIYWRCSADSGTIVFRATGLTSGRTDDVSILQYIKSECDEAPTIRGDSDQRKLLARVDIFHTPFEPWPSCKSGTTGTLERDSVVTVVGEAGGYYLLNQGGYIRKSRTERLGPPQPVRTTAWCPGEYPHVHRNVFQSPDPDLGGTTAYLVGNGSSPLEQITRDAVAVNGFCTREIRIPAGTRMVVGKYGHNFKGYFHGNRWIYLPNTTPVRLIPTWATEAIGMCAGALAGIGLGAEGSVCAWLDNRGNIAYNDNIAVGAYLGGGGSLTAAYARNIRSLNDIGGLSTCTSTPVGGLCASWTTSTRVYVGLTPGAALTGELAPDPNIPLSFNFSGGAGLAWGRVVTPRESVKRELAEIICTLHQGSNQAPYKSYCEELTNDSPPRRGGGGPVRVQ